MAIANGAKLTAANLNNAFVCKTGDQVMDGILEVVAMRYGKRSEAAPLTALTADVGIIEVTGSGVSNITTISGGEDGQQFIVVNNSSSIVTITQGSKSVDIDPGCQTIMTKCGATWALLQAGGGEALNDRTDVSVAGVAANQTISWDGTAWVPLTLPSLVPRTIFRATASTDQTGLTSGVDHVLDFTVTDFDNDGGYNGTNQYTTVRDDYYDLNFAMNFSNTAGGQRIIGKFLVNGIVVATNVDTIAPVGTGAECTTTVFIPSGQVIQCVIEHFDTNTIQTSVAAGLAANPVVFFGYFEILGRGQA